MNFHIYTFRCRRARARSYFIICLSCSHVCVCQQNCDLVVVLILGSFRSVGRGLTRAHVGGRGGGGGGGGPDYSHHCLRTTSRVVSCSWASPGPTSVAFTVAVFSFFCMLSEIRTHLISTL